MKKWVDIGGIVLVVVLVGVGVWMMTAGETPASPQKVTAAPQEEKEEEKGNSPSEVALPQDTQEVAQEVKVPKVVEGTHSIKGYVQTDPARIHDAAAAARTVVTGMDGQERVVKGWSPFKEPVDRMVWAAIRPGGMPSGLRSLYARMRHASGGDDAFVEALRRASIEIEEGDSEEVAAMKVQTRQMKEDLLDWIEEGNSVEEAIARIEEAVRPERIEMHQARMMVRKFRQEGDAEGARDFINAENERLHSKGLPEMRMPEFAKEYEDGDDENE